MRAGSRGLLELHSSLQVSEFESSSHEYHHLLGSEVAGIFFSRGFLHALCKKKLPLVGCIVASLPAPLAPCAHTRFAVPSYIMLLCVCLHPGTPLNNTAGITMQ